MRSIDTAQRSAVEQEPMTLPAPKKNSALNAVTPANQPTPKEQAGWDPFEIWRTRVLLPRLAEARESKTAAAPAAAIKLVRP
jgi:hypothetical protein